MKACRTPWSQVRDELEPLRPKASNQQITLTVATLTLRARYSISVGGLSEVKQSGILHFGNPFGTPEVRVRLENLTSRDATRMVALDCG